MHRRALVLTVSKCGLLKFPDAVDYSWPAEPRSSLKAVKTFSSVSRSALPPTKRKGRPPISRARASLLEPQNVLCLFRRLLASIFRTLAAQLQLSLSQGCVHDVVSAPVLLSGLYRLFAEEVLFARSMTARRSFSRTPTRRPMRTRGRPTRLRQACANGGSTELHSHDLQS